MTKELTAIRLEPKQLAELSKIAKREDRAVSYIIRKAIDEYIKRKKRRVAVHGRVSNDDEGQSPEMHTRELREFL